MFAVNQLNGFNAGGGKISFVLTDTVAVDTTNAAAYTFTNAAIGSDEGSDRDIVVIGVADSAGSVRTLSSVSIGGTNATIDRFFDPTANRGGNFIARRRIPTGSTATVIVTYDSTVANCAIYVCAMKGASTTVYNTPTQYTITSGDTSASITPDWVSGGLVVAQVSNTNGSTHSWSAGVDLGGQRGVEGGSRQSVGWRLQTADTLAGTVTAAFTSGGSGRLLAVSYAPA